MSSPADRPIDPRDPSAYAPKWARDPATAERRNAARQRSVSELTNSDFSGSATTESWFADDATPTERCPIRPSLDPIVLPAPPFRPRARFPFSIVGLTVAAAAVAVLLAVGKLQPWSVVAMDDSLEIASFDSRFIEQPTPTSITDRETFPSSSQLAGVKVAARPIDDKTLLGETLSGSETSGHKHNDQAGRPDPGRARSRGNRRIGHTRPGTSGHRRHRSGPRRPTASGRGPRPRRWRWPRPTTRSCWKRSAFSAQMLPTSGRHGTGTRRRRSWARRKRRDGWKCWPGGNGRWHYSR
jgi:hypothetical protein